MAKKKQPKYDLLTVLIIVLAVAVTGGAALYIFRRNGNGHGGNLQAAERDNISQLAEPARTSPAAATGSSAPATWKEVRNSFFSANPFAYVDERQVSSRLNIRDRPGQAGNVVGSAGPGEYVGRHTGLSTDIGWPTSPGRWAKINLANGGTGWVFSGYLKSEKQQRALNGFALHGLGCACGSCKQQQAVMNGFTLA